MPKVFYNPIPVLRIQNQVSPTSIINFNNFSGCGWSKKANKSFNHENNY